MPTRAWVILGPEWKAAVAALATVERELPSWLRDELNDSATPLADRARAAVLNVDVRGGPAGSTGLRRRVAAGVGVRTGLSAPTAPYLRIYTSMADPAQAPIPMGLDQAAGWRHPLYGNKNYWYQSTPSNPGWFTDTISDGSDQIERALESALERAARTVNAAS